MFKKLLPFVFIIIFSLVANMAQQTVTYAETNGRGPQPRNPQSTIIYTASSDILTNPERGFYQHEETSSSSYTALDTADLLNYRSNHVSLILRLFYMEDFSSSAISQSYLNAMTTDFAALRQTGMKAVVRFAYAKPPGWPPTTPYGDASKAQLLAHLAQLEPLLKANSDVIAVVQTGFIGLWGEWYYTDHFGDLGAISPADYAKRREITYRLLEALPLSRMIQLRTPNYKQQIVENINPISSGTAFNGTYLARIGHHNDCFLASDTDFGTYVDASQTEYPYLTADTTYTPMGGETCAQNPPRSECATALSEMALFHWSYIHNGYKLEVLNDWVTGGCMDTIKEKLGYRFVLEQGTFSDAVRPGDAFDINLRLHNEGFAAPYNPRLVQILLRNTSNGDLFAATLAEDPRLWPANNTADTIINHTLCTPLSMPPGDYDLLLNLPDPQPGLRSTAAYSILTANDGGVRESATGYNDLLHTITVNNSAPATPCAGNQTLTPWSATAVAPTLTIQATTTVKLLWNAITANCTTAIYDSLTPYFTAAASTLRDDTLLPGTLIYDVLNDSSDAAHYYQVQGVNCRGSSTAVSNEVGLFRFPLISS